jgi:predicted molibdopterin-dependent oxidoreductase YjgC
VHDLFASPLSQRADLVVPEAVFAERDGSFVNLHDRLQSFGFAIRPPAGVVPAGRLLWTLLGKQGLYNARQVLQDAAREITLLSNAIGEIPETGVDLRGNLLA